MGTVLHHLRGIWYQLIFVIVIIGNELTQLIFLTQCIETLVIAMVNGFQYPRHYNRFMYGQASW